jgi:hypothetical protein
MGRKNDRDGLFAAPRSFYLTIHPKRAETFGLALSSSPDASDVDGLTISASATQVGRVLDGLISALKASGHSPGLLSVNLGAPLELNEAAGVRLSLIFFASQPLKRHDRIRAIVAGVNAMSVEETYYWYAKCVGAESARARKALRVLLSDEKAVS